LAQATEAEEEEEKRKAAAVAGGRSLEKSNEKSYKQVKAKCKKRHKQIAAVAKKHGFDDSY
jgi:hypothetical protein